MKTGDRLIEFLDERVFKCRWQWVCDENDRRLRDESRRIRNGESR